MRQYDLSTDSLRDSPCRVGRDAALTVPTVALPVLLVFFGMRLATYLLMRERKAAAYRKILYDETNQKKKPLGVVIAVWLFCALLSGIGAGLSWWQWLIAAIGYLGILYVMFSGARRLELRQDEVYGSDPEYQPYVKRTPILLPLLPIYSVKKYTWLQG